MYKNHCRLIFLKSELQYFNPFQNASAMNEGAVGNFEFVPPPNFYGVREKSFRK